MKNQISKYKLIINIIGRWMKDEEPPLIKQKDKDPNNKLIILPNTEYIQI